MIWESALLITASAVIQIANRMSEKGGGGGGGSDGELEQRVTREGCEVGRRTEKPNNVMKVDER